MIISQHLAELAKPRRTRAEALSNIRASGVEINLLDESTHLIKTGTVVLKFQGLWPEDELFTNNPLGMLNISKVWRTLQQRFPRPQIYEFKTMDLLPMLEGIDVDERAAKYLSARRRELPVLLGMWRQSAFLVDGAHRVAARYHHGLATTVGFVISEHDLEQSRVRILRLDDGNSWCPLDTTGGFPNPSS